jgi:cardiolipin synthase C
MNARIKNTKLRPQHWKYWSLLLFIFCISLVGCSLPSNENRTISTALGVDEANATRLGKAISPRAEKHSGLSGVHPLPDPLDAFASRVLLIRQAERTLDVQYYIWHADMTGTLLMKELLDAAERGVRVRLLLDDNGIYGTDYELAALNEHPNFEIRLFNPFVVRKPKWFGNVTHFSRLNRRMHNKSITADNMLTIAGGRNVGDPYFGVSDGTLYSDLDVLLAGPIVNEVSNDFDRYWASKSSFPAERILPDADPNLLLQSTQKSSGFDRDPSASIYINAIRQSEFIADLQSGNLEMEWTNIQMVSDDPAKGLGEHTPEGLLTQQLREVLGVPQKEVTLISAYFVPTTSGVKAFRKMTGRGVSVRILTNSLGANDVTVVHAGYSKYRKDLLVAGVQLFETRRLDEVSEFVEIARPFGSSATSLHAKTFSVDNKHVFVGSFNFDPRSINLNTELGFVIESPGLAQKISNVFDGNIPASTYEVKLNNEGDLYWVEQQNGNIIRHDTEPQSSFWTRIWIWFLSVMPIEWLL